MKPISMSKGTGQLLGVVLAFGLVAAFISNGEDRPSASVSERKSDTPPDPYGNCVLRPLKNEVSNFSRIVRESLRNPASFEHVQTTVGPVEDGIFGVITIYRGTNGFGAVDTGVATGEVRVRDCAPKLVTID